jgi:CHASE2 domain-containing sensor protein
MKTKVRVTRTQVLKESILATIILLIVTYLISFIPWSLEYGKALHQGFADFDIYDLYYSGINKENTRRDSNIVLVQIDTGRNEIAEQIDLLSSYDPKVIAIDAFFETPSENDSAFVQTINSKSNLVFLNRNTDKGFTPNIFYNNPDRCGFANFIGDRYSVIRTFYPRYKENETQRDAFAACIARMADAESYKKLNRRNNDQELINYRGNLETYTNLSTDELLQYHLAGQLESIIKNKIVLLGFFVKDTSHLIIEDLHYTPLNEVVSGKSFPDMYGVAIHANILSMILSSHYATLASAFTSYMFAFFITLCFNYYILSKYRKNEHPSHTVFLLMQVFIILFMLYFFLKLYDWFLFKVPLESTMISLVLSLEFFGIYKSLALWLNKKYQYKTVFNHKRAV